MHDHFLYETRHAKSNWNQKHLIEDLVTGYPFIVISSSADWKMGQFGIDDT